MFEFDQGSIGIIRRLQDHERRVKKGIKSAFFVIGKSLNKEFKRQVKEDPKTGRIYFINGRRHQASAPGQTAANLTGVYRKSVGYKNKGSELEFGNSAKYAGWLEEGTKNMEARPGLKNTLKAEEKNTLNTFVFEMLKKS